MEIGNETKKKNFFRKHPILTGILGLILLFIVIGAIGSSGSKSNSNSQSTQTGNSNNAQPTATTQPEKPKQWVTAIEASGNANKNTDTFELKGGKTKIIYTFSGGDVIVGSIYVLKEGTDLMKQGGIPEVTVTNAGSDSTFITKSAGSYYLSVKSANTSWTVKVEEER